MMLYQLAGIDPVEAMRKAGWGNKEVIFHKRDVLLWRSWGVFPPVLFDVGLVMTLPSGRDVTFVPCKKTSKPALKPVPSDGYREWVRTPNATEMLVLVRPYEGQPMAPITEEVQS